MIAAFVGTPGSGKTYDAVKKIVDNMRKIEGKSPRHIYTNIEGMDEPECQHYLKDYLGYDDYEFSKYFHWKSDKEIVNFYEYVKDNSLIVIDEIHKLYSNRDWQTDKNKQFADWCSTHRHFGCDLIFITQDMEKVEKHVRSLVQWSYLYRKVDFMGGAVKRKYIKYSYSGDDVKCKALTTNTGTYESHIFNCYKSYSTQDAKELGFMKGINIFKHPIFYALPVVICLTLYLFFGKSSFATGDILGSKKVMKNFEQRTAIQKKYSSNSPPITIKPSSQMTDETSQPVRSPLVPVQREYEIPIVKAIASAGNDFFVLLSDGRSIKTKIVYAVNQRYVEETK